jgi:hypothetical protein
MLYRLRNKFRIEKTTIIKNLKIEGVRIFMQRSICPHTYIKISAFMNGIELGINQIIPKNLKHQSNIAYVVKAELSANI